MEKKSSFKKVLKVLLFIFLILLVLFIIHTLRNFFIVKSLQENIAPYLESNNFHIKSVATEESGLLATMNYYEKDGKKVMFFEKNDNGKIAKMSMYDTGVSKNNFFDSEAGKTAQLNVETQMFVDIYNYLETENFGQTLFASMTAKIRLAEYNGKKCYVIDDFFSPFFMMGTQKNEVFIEKDTGLLLKSVMDSTSSEREYEFDNVDDSIFNEPDISQYEVRN